MKLDVSKVYESIKLDYIEHMLRSFGFHEIWTKWIMTCVITVTYSVQINGHKIGFLYPSRGIRQGYPLSPYLFLLCIEGISHKIKYSNLQGLKLSRRDPKLIHLLFTDDSIIYSKPSVQEVEEISLILHRWCLRSKDGSRFRIYFGKLGFYFFLVSFYYPSFLSFCDV